MSRRKRSFEQMDTDSLYPAFKRRKIWNTPYTDSNEQKEEENLLQSCMEEISEDNQADTESIASFVESVDSLESDINHNHDRDQDAEQHANDEEICRDILCKLQFNADVIIPCHHLCQTVCILGGNYKYLQSMMRDITNDLLRVITDYNFKLQLVNVLDTEKQNEQKTKLISTVIAQNLLEKQSFSNICYQKEKTKDTNDCDICIAFPDENLSVLCQIMHFIASPSTQSVIDGNGNRNRNLRVTPYQKRVLLVNIGGFWNGMKLQIMNFTTNHLPNPVNVVFVDDLNDAVKQLKHWSA